MVIGRKALISSWVGLIGLFFLAPPGPIQAQTLAVGGQVTLNRDLEEDNTWGFGPRAVFGIPLTGISLQATADFYSPGCGTGDCDLRDVGINLLWSLPVPYVANPYFGAGLAMQEWSGDREGGDDTDYGVNFLAGVVLQGPTFQRFQPFVEAKYQAMQDFDAQLVFSGGILLKIL